MARILLIQGHPDAGQGHLCYALADAYANGAADAGHEVDRYSIAEQPVGFIRSKADFEDADVPDYARHAQEAIKAADHIVMVFPLWLGGMPALVKAWMEQTFRYGFAMEVHDKGFRRLLKGKTAHVVVTMGMPAFFYRLYFRSHGTGVLRRSILGFSGVGPIRQTLIGRVDDLGKDGVQKWLGRMREDGARAA